MLNLEFRTTGKRYLMKNKTDALINGVAAYKLLATRVPRIGLAASDRNEVRLMTDKEANSATVTPQ